MVHNISLKPLFTILGLLLMVCFAFGQGKPTIAVLSLEAKNTHQETADAVADILSTELFNSKKFNVVERQLITRILEEQKLQMTGVTDMSQAVEIGKVLNVEKIMIGSVSRLGQTFIINTRLVDVKTGALELAQNAKSTSGEDGLTNAVADLVRIISQKVQIEGAIIKINHNVILIDLGSNHGFAENQELAVIRLGDVITDLGGSNVGRSEDVIGAIKLTSVKADYSEAIVSQAKISFRPGDRVRVTTLKIKVDSEEAKKVDKPKQESDKKARPTEPPPF